MAWRWRDIIVGAIFVGAGLVAGIEFLALRTQMVALAFGFGIIVYGMMHGIFIGVCIAILVLTQDESGSAWGLWIVVPIIAATYVYVVRRNRRRAIADSHNYDDTLTIPPHSPDPQDDPPTAEKHVARLERELAQKKWH